MKNFKFLLVALMGIALVSCTPEETQTEFLLSDLQGLWRQDNTQTYFRFTTDQVDGELGYFWGCEWDEAQDWHESDLVFHGDGWFKYQLDENQLLEIHKSDEGWMDIPRRYVLTLLTSTKMSYYTKGYSKEKYHFTKQ